jgi:hypothetical protein
LKLAIEPGRDRSIILKSRGRYPVTDLLAIFKMFVGI